MEWLRSIFKKYNANELKFLFEEVDAGKFKTADVAVNSFTEEAGMGVTIQANKILRTKEISLDSGKKEYEYLDSKTSRAIISAISARVINEQLKSDNPEFDIVESVKESLNLYKNLYNNDTELYRSLNSSDKRKLRAVRKAFNEYGKDIVDGVSFI
jgi:hypothetical protein